MSDDDDEHNSGSGVAFSDDRNMYTVDDWMSSFRT